MAEGSTGSSDENNMAMLAHILGIITSFIGPLVLYLTVKDKPYVIEQTKEALNFQITIAILYVVGAILTIIIIGGLIYAAAGILSLIFGIIAAMAASKGEHYRYPFAIRMIK